MSCPETDFLFIILIVFVHDVGSLLVSMNDSPLIRRKISRERVGLQLQSVSSLPEVKEAAFEKFGFEKVMH